MICVWRLTASEVYSLQAISPHVAETCSIPPRNIDVCLDSKMAKVGERWCTFNKGAEEIGAGFLRPLLQMQKREMA